MTYQQKLEAMTDKKLNIGLYLTTQKSFTKFPASIPDYCNNYNDIMPIAFENELSLCWDMCGVCVWGESACLDPDNW